MAFLKHPEIKDCVTDLKTYLNRMLKMEANLHDNDSVSVINAYTQTSSVEDAQAEQYYDDIERAMADSDSKYKVTAGDFNEKLELQQKEFKSMETFGIGGKNGRGDGCIDFTEEPKLIIANTLFRKPNNRYWTWKLPDLETRKHTNFELSDQKKKKKRIVTNCKVIRKTDIGSDHQLVRMTLNIYLKKKKRLSMLNSIIKKKKQTPFNINTQKLKGTKGIFQINLKTDFINLRR